MPTPAVERRGNVPLARYTTLGLGGPAATFVSADSAERLVAEVTRADRAGEPVLLLGGGSNLVIADAGFPGTVVHLTSRGIQTKTAGDGCVLVTAQAGEQWDAFVASCVAGGLSGVECLSGIPGLVGATPVQNVGAYGQEVAQTVVRVRVLDRSDGTVTELDRGQCRFAYRDSAFKGSDRYMVLAVTFALTAAPESAPVGYAELARRLGVAVGERAPLARVREAVLALRRGKGMVLDPDDPDTHSAGSFFTNPILDAAAFAAFERRVAARLGEVPIPRYPAGDGLVKTSAAWLIERAGFPKGYRRGPARISTKHTLALTNPGGARTADLLALAAEVAGGVEAAFGVRLVNEPILVGASM